VMPRSNQIPRRTEMTRCATTGLMRCSKNVPQQRTLFDLLIGADERSRRNGEAERWYRR
jgi:hypothetical protein